MLLEESKIPQHLKKYFTKESNGVKSNSHPTVKPLSLLRYLVRLTRTPNGGIVLDPFSGSGSTGVACAAENRDFIGIEMEPEYVEIARARIRQAQHDYRAEQLTLF